MRERLRADGVALHDAANELMFTHDMAVLQRHQERVHLYRRDLDAFAAALLEFEREFGPLD